MQIVKVKGSSPSVQLDEAQRRQMVSAGRQPAAEECICGERDTAGHASRGTFAVAPCLTPFALNPVFRPAVLLPRVLTNHEVGPVPPSQLLVSLGGVHSKLDSGLAGAAGLAGD